MIPTPEAPRPRSEPISQQGSLRVSLLYLLLGDVAAVLALLGIVTRGADGGLLLLGAVTLPLVAIALVRPYLLRLAWGQQLRTLRASVPCMVAAGLGAAVMALTLGLGTLGHDAGGLLSADDLGPVDELVVVPPSSDLDAAATVVNASLAVPEVRALVDADPLPIRRTMAIVSRQEAVGLSVQLLELDAVRASRFGGDPAANAMPTEPLGASHALATRDLADELGLHPGSVLPPPLGITIDAVVERRGITGLASSAGDRVPNLIVGAGTIDLLRRGGWSAAVDSVLALSNAGGTMDGVVYSDRVASAVRDALANADQADGDVLFAPEPVDHGLDRVVVETVKADAVRQEAFRRTATDAPLGLVSVIGSTLAAGLIGLSVALAVMRRRKDLAVMRTAGMSRSAAVSVQLMASWLTFLLSTLAGSVAGALLAQLAAGPAVRDVGGVATSSPRVDAGAALSFAWGLAVVLLMLSTAAAGIIQVRSTVHGSSNPPLGMRRKPWGRSVSYSIMVAGVLLAAWGLSNGSDACVVVGLTAMVLGVSALTGWLALLTLLLPIGIVCAGPTGSLWRTTGVGASLSLGIAVIGALLVEVSCMTNLLRRGASEDSVDERLIGTRPALAGSARHVLVSAAAVLVAAAGMTGSLVAAASDLPGSRNASVVVRSLAEPSLRQGDLQAVPGLGTVTALSLDTVDLSFDGGQQFAGARMVSGAEALSDGDRPRLVSSTGWTGTLDTAGSVVLAPDLLPLRLSPTAAVGTAVVVRDRSTGRTLTAQVAGVLDAPNALAGLWAGTNLAASLTGAPPNQSILVVTPAPGVRRSLLASALAGSLRGRAARVDTRTSLVASRWPLAGHIVAATRWTMVMLWALAGLALATLVLRSAFERRRELRFLEPGLRLERSIGWLLLRDTALAVLVGTVTGSLVGVAIGIRLVGRPEAPMRVVVAPLLFIGGPVVCAAGALLAAVFAARWSISHRAGRALSS